MDNKPNFWGPIAGIRRTEGSVNSTVTTELVYERKGCDTFHPLKEATTEFAVEVSFSDGGGNRWINTMSAKQLDDVIAQLQAIKARMVGTMASSDVKAIFAENNRAFEKMCITRAAAEQTGLPAARHCRGGVDVGRAGSRRVWEGALDGPASVHRDEVQRRILEKLTEILAALQQQLAERLRSEIYVRPKVDLVPPGTLPVAEGKAKRVLDKRSL